MNQTTACIQEEAVLGQRWRLTQNTRTKSLPEPLLCVWGLIGHTRVLDGGGVERREHGWPPLYQSDNSSSTQTKLTCRCTGHVQALCGNKSHWIRGRYLSDPLNAPSLPLLSPDGKMCLSAWLAAETVGWAAQFWKKLVFGLGSVGYYMYIYFDPAAGWRSYFYCTMHSSIPLDHLLALQLMQQDRRGYG